MRSLRSLLEAPGHASLAAGALLGAGALACPCPTCVLASGGFLAHGVWRKLAALRAPVIR